jgi:hypothetical protein
MVYFSRIQAFWQHKIHQTSKSAASFRTAHKRSRSLNKTQSLPELRVICAIAETCEKPTRRRRNIIPIRRSNGIKIIKKFRNLEHRDYCIS